jgi:CRP-like cAMP-binding protein
MALLDVAGITDNTRSATVTANDDMWISVMSVQEFRRVLTEFAEAAEQLRRSATDRAALSQA